MADREGAIEWLCPVDSQGFDRCLSNCGQPNDMEVFVNEDEVFRPAIGTWIKESVQLSANPVCQLLPLAAIAKGATPGKIIEMVWPATFGNRR